MRFVLLALLLNLHCECFAWGCFDWLCAEEGEEAPLLVSCKKFELKLYESPEDFFLAYGDDDVPEINFQYLLNRLAKPPKFIFEAVPPGFTVTALNRRFSQLEIGVAIKNIRFFVHEGQDSFYEVKTPTVADLTGKKVVALFYARELCDVGLN